MATVRRASRESFEMPVDSPLESFEMPSDLPADFVTSQKPDVRKPSSFRPLRRPRAVPGGSSVPPNDSDTLDESHAIVRAKHAIPHSSMSGLPPSSPVGSYATSPGPDSRMQLADSHSPDLRVRCAGLPSPDASGATTSSRGGIPVAGDARDQETLRLLTAVMKAQRESLSSDLPRSVRAAIDYVSRFKIKDANSLVKHMQIAFKQPKSEEELCIVTKALDALKSELRDLKQGLVDAVVATEDVDNFLRTFSDAHVLNRAKTVLGKVLCGHYKNAPGALVHGRSIIETFFIATDLHSKNISKKLTGKNVLKKGEHKDGFLVHYLYTRSGDKDSGNVARLQPELDKLDAILDGLRNLKCVDPEDETELKRLTKRLAATATGKLVRTTGSRGSDAPPAQSSSSKVAVANTSRPSSSVRMRGNVPGKPDYVQKLAKSQVSVNPEDTLYRKEERQPQPTPLVIRHLGNYQLLPKRTYDPKSTRRKSILSRSRPKSPSAAIPRISFSGPVSAVEIEHCADRRNYDGCDPLRPVDHEHEALVSSRCMLLSRRACLALGMVNDFNIFNLNQKVSGQPIVSTTTYRLPPLNP